MNSQGDPKIVDVALLGDVRNSANKLIEVIDHDDDRKFFITHFKKLIAVNRR